MIGPRGYSRVYVGTGDPISGEPIVDFRLLFTGTIPTASKNKTRAVEKHAIRKAFHPQLRRLWYSNNPLRHLASCSILPVGSGQHLEATDERVSDGLRNISRIWERSGFNFVPLVTDNMFLRCSIDILLLRPNDKRFIFERGDIDGQLKTLFDALRMPASSQETSGATPDEGEDPFFCLLEDDRLISEVKVASQDLLLLPGEREVKATDAFAVVHVVLSELNPTFIPNFAYADVMEAQSSGKQEQ